MYFTYFWGVLEEGYSPRRAKLELGNLEIESEKKYCYS